MKGTLALPIALCLTAPILDPLYAFSASLRAQHYPLDAETVDELSEAMPELAERLLAEADGPAAGPDGVPARELEPSDRFRLQILAARWAGALASIEAARDTLRRARAPFAELAYLQYEIYARARQGQERGEGGFDKVFGDIFRLAFARLDDRSAFQVAGRLRYSFDLARRQLRVVLDGRPKADRAAGRIGKADALRLARTYQPFLVYRRINPLVTELVTQDDRRRYAIQDDILIHSDGVATLSATVFLPRRFSTPQPTALLFNIYAEPAIDLFYAKLAAAHGYIGVVADARGKRLSPDEVEPYEHETTDTHAVLDWIVEQPWSNGKVGIWGGSYAGYAAWAATKERHPALKTIVASAAAIPGLGLPMHNNVFLNANYCWVFHVTNEKGLDHEVCRDRGRWERMEARWYATGRPYREIDAIDGTPNPWLRRWLEHPDYDAYWHSKVPYGDDFAGIDIPVLSLTGYYDDGQVSALHYLREHVRHNPEAEHYLVIGPYDHETAQSGPRPILRGYRLDPSAIIDPLEITFRWLDHVLRDGEKPLILEDRINAQVMGADAWRHAPSLTALAPDTLKLYLSDGPATISDLEGAEATDSTSPRSETNRSILGSGPGGSSRPVYTLTQAPPTRPGSLRQTVDFADRGSNSYADYYPARVVRDELEPGDAVVFVSEPLKEAVEILGSFGGRLRATINKKDMDVLLVLYERTPEGRYFHLSYYLGRASYAEDMTTRHLLHPGIPASIPIQRSYMTGRRLGAGSRLVAVLDVNKGPWAQVNYGTGGDVADESISDAGEPLEVDWHTDSYLLLPVLPRLKPPRARCSG